MSHRDGLIIMLSQTQNASSFRPNAKARGDESWDAYAWMKDAGALYAEVKPAAFTKQSPTKSSRNSYFQNELLPTRPSRCDPNMPRAGSWTGRPSVQYCIDRRTNEGASSRL
jgi:hypothetical protein